MHMLLLNLFPLKLISASEDTYVRVWKISADDNPTVSFVNIDLKSFSDLVT